MFTSIAFNFSSFSFIISGIVELILEDTYPHPPGKISKDEYSVRFAVHNGLPENCILNMTVSQDDEIIENVGESVQCESCLKWFHVLCVNFFDSSEWYCNECENTRF